MSLDCKARLMRITGFGRRLCVKLQSGDTLIEVIVALLILGMMILGLAPLFSRIHIYERMNAVKAEAYNMAEGQVEAIKSAPYASKQKADGSWSGMGTYTMVNGNIVYGDPPGPFLQVTTYTDPNTPGIAYYMDTQIRYKPDPSRSPGDPTTVDYKDITVEVKAQIPGIPPALLPDITLNTRATQENQWGEMPGGNIYVEAKNGNSPVGNMAVFLLGPWGPNLTTYEGWTDAPSGDMPGTYLFASLLPGTYTMVATDSTNPWDGWMVEPGVTSSYGAGNPSIFPLNTSNGQQCTITTNATTYMSFQAEPAPQVTLQFNHTYNGTIRLNGTGTGWSYPSLYTSYNVPLSMSYLVPDSIYPDTYSLTLSGGYTAGNITVPVPSANNPKESIPVNLSP